MSMSIADIEGMSVKRTKSELPKGKRTQEEQDDGRTLAKDERKSRGEAEARGARRH